MVIRSLIFIAVFIGSSADIFAQNLTHLGLLPRINYQKPIDEHFSLNFTAFSEIDAGDNILDEMPVPSKVINLTFVGGVAYKINLNSIVTGGYLFRVIDPFIEDTRVEHRFVSQFVHIHHFRSLRIRHHFRVEERFIQAPISNDFNAVTRLSYSLGWDIPLQGRHLNANEFYVNSVSSYFVQPTRPRTAFHNLTEFYLGLGYQTENIGRFEIGPEAKISVINGEGNVNALIFIDFIWYPSFKKKKK